MLRMKKNKKKNQTNQLTKEKFESQHTPQLNLRDLQMGQLLAWYLSDSAEGKKKAEMKEVQSTKFTVNS